MDRSKPSGQLFGFDVDLGLEKVKSPSHIPGMLQDMDRIEAASIYSLPISKEHVPGQIMKEESPPKEV